MLETSLITSPARAVLLTACLALGCTTIHAPSDAGTAGDGAACSCTGRECGDDGCGATCGFCSAGETCVDGVCGDCPRSCAGRECGDNGCGGLCGTCPTGQVCSVAGQCEGGCEASCAGRECGVDSCGTGSCGTCPAGEACEEGTCTPTCTPSCVGRECGPTSCGTGSCGTCPSGESCSESGTCETICVPDCAGRMCGSDGCTGSCGTCGAGDVCDAAGQCVCAAPVTCYRDRDGDGYPNPNTMCTMTVCECPAGYITARADDAWDCHDGEASIRPGASYGDSYYCPGAVNNCSGLGVTCSHGGTYDRNCDGVSQQRWTTTGGGCLFVIGSGCRVVNGGAGWTGSVPACGYSGTWFTGTCNSSCMAINEVRTQECR